MQQVSTLRLMLFIGLKKIKRARTEYDTDCIYQ